MDLLLPLTPSLQLLIRPSVSGLNAPANRLRNISRYVRWTTDIEHRAFVEHQVTHPSSVFLDSVLHVPLRL
jgi:hypothetical protein